MEINILGIIIIVALLAGAIDGYKKGLVEGVIRLFSTIVGIAVLAILVKGFDDFMEKSYVKVIMAVLLLLIVNIANKIIKIILDSVKLVAALPIVSWLDKVAGLVFGVVQMVFLIWVIFSLLGIVEIPTISAWFNQQIESSKLLTWLYEKNYIAHLLNTYYL